MNESNYFQKGVILIIAILLATPNMRTYLVIGSYKIYSQALTENNYFEHSSARGKTPKNLTAAAASLALIGAIYAVSLVFVAVYSAYNQIDFVDDDSYARRHILEFNNFDLNYRKYDFSEFDN